MGWDGMGNNIAQCVSYIMKEEYLLDAGQLECNMGRLVQGPQWLRCCVMMESSRVSGATTALQLQHQYCPVDARREYLFISRLTSTGVGGFSYICLF